MALQELSYYIIEPTTGETTSEPFRSSEAAGPYVFLDKNGPQTLGGWYIDMLTPDSTTEDWQELVELSPFDEAYLLPGEGIYRIRKTFTFYEVGVFINRAKVSPDWLIEPTTLEETSATSILVEDRPATMAVKLVGATTTDTKVNVDILDPSGGWQRFFRFDLATGLADRLLYLPARGVYRVRKTAGDIQTGVFVYR